MSDVVTMPKRWDVAALVLGGFVTLAGVMHFVNPDFFNDIVPPWLPPSESFWTYVSGVAEIVIAVLILRRSTRRVGAIAAIWLFLAVYPANLYMAWDWRDRPAGDQFISYGRLPFQFLFIWLAWRVARANTNEPAVPGDVD
ncbi:MAG: MauE/DoxX family redox-associated membrane protein [Actinomycetota bacterium]